MQSVGRTHLLFYYSVYDARGSTVARVHNLRVYADYADEPSSITSDGIQPSFASRQAEIDLSVALKKSTGVNIPANSRKLDFTLGNIRDAGTVGGRDAESPNATTDAFEREGKGGRKGRPPMGGGTPSPNCILYLQYTITT